MQVGIARVEMLKAQVDLVSHRKANWDWLDMPAWMPPCARAGNALTILVKGELVTSLLVSTARINQITLCSPKQRQHPMRQWYL